ncbi:puromycin-sensitive aminopeptidase-like [Diaphorina citri]|uniref:Aminopeptidase n=1 Tax=Diaphorina citri TaxID=121845 RepID=A0A3Q0J6P7_DIACI|nr:puromycin-sensitive aminopeptidase-like [Diaphorina citri]
MLEKKPFERLPKYAVPVLYDLFLKPNLKAYTFEGITKININIVSETKELKLHVIDLDFKKVQLELADGKVLTPETKISTEDETITLTFSETLPVGEVKLLFEYVGELNDKMKGFYRSKYRSILDDEDRYMAVTQFELTDARRCFPCWDEPAVKAKFSISLSVPNNKVALSNMPVKSESPQPDGHRLLQFETSPIMSTYLVAVVVGEFDYVEETSSDGVLVRVYTPVGKREQGQFALHVASKVLPFYKDYFNIAYPLPKIDLVAVLSPPKPGPVISVDASVQNEDGSRTLTLSQTKFSADGSTDSSSDSLWYVPLSFCTQANPSEEVFSAEMSTRVTQVTIPDVSPGHWIKLNPGTVGYYRVKYPRETLAQFIPSVEDKSIPPLDRLSLLDDLFALAQVGEVSLVEVLKMIQSMTHEDNYTVWITICNCLQKIDLLLSNTEYHHLFYQFGVLILKPAGQSLGWEPKANENHLNTLLRSLIISRLGSKNKPVKSESPQPDGHRLLQFETSPIMSTYLVAVVVGEFDYVEETSSDGVLVRVYTPVGKREQGQFALHVASKVLPFYKDYFNIAYPLPKIDLVALNPGTVGYYRVKYPRETLAQFIPSVEDKSIPPLDRLSLLDDLFACHGELGPSHLSGSVSSGRLSEHIGYHPTEHSSGCGARVGSPVMENWGLVTYREVCLLVDSQNTSAITRQNIALVVGHELAHQWFGNLVTMEWWTHLWLNEGYASFVEFLCVHHLFPEYDIWTQFVTDNLVRALELDALKSSHPTQGYASFVEFLCVHHLFPEYDIWTQFVTDNLVRALELDALKSSHPIELYQNSDMQEEKDRISRSFSALKDPELLRKVLDFSMSDLVRAQDSVFVIISAAQTKTGRELAWEFLKNNYATFTERYKGGLLGRLVKHTTENFASESHAQEVTEFFTKNPTSWIERTVQQSVETIRLNSECLKRDGEAVKQFLSTL